MPAPHRHRVTGAAGLVVLTVLLGACTDGTAAPTVDDGPVTVQPGAPGEPSRVVDPDEASDATGDEHTDADIAFMQGMIPHHVQALRMTRLVPDRTGRDDLLLFTERMDISQEGELELMQAWLEGVGAEVPLLSADHDHGDGDQMGGVNDGDLMPGMLTEQELLELESLEGEAFDRMFLASMIRHHEGAITMVEQLFADGGGIDARIFDFANHVRSDQSIEISRMRTMLADLDA